MSKRISIKLSSIALEEFKKILTKIDINPEKALNIYLKEIQRTWGMGFRPHIPKEPFSSNSKLFSKDDKILFEPELDEELVNSAEHILSKLSVPLPEALRIFIYQFVREGTFPIPLIDQPDNLCEKVETYERKNNIVVNIFVADSKSE